MTAQYVTLTHLTGGGTMLERKGPIVLRITSIDAVSTADVGSWIKVGDRRFQVQETVEQVSALFSVAAAEQTPVVMLPDDGR